MSSLYEMLKAARASAVPAGEAEDGVARNMIADHKANQSNPHKVTKAQVGLSNVDNTADIDKPVSAAVQSALNSAIAAESDAREAADEETTAALAELSDKANFTYGYLFDLGTELTNNANLNDYAYTCKVYVSTGAIAQTIQNTPWTASGFMVITIPFLTKSTFFQFLLPNTITGKWYRRRYTMGAWGNWIEYDGTALQSGT